MPYCIAGSLSLFLILDKQAFQKLKLARKYELIKADGEHIAARIYNTYNVHLFSYNKYYVEVWYRLSLNQIAYIEVVNDERILDNYLDNLNINEDLEID